jgi:hypothetical protein
VAVSSGGAGCPLPAGLVPEDVLGELRALCPRRLRERFETSTVMK